PVGGGPGRAAVAEHDVSTGRADPDQDGHRGDAEGVQPGGGTAPGTRRTTRPWPATARPVGKVDLRFGDRGGAPLHGYRRRTAGRARSIPGRTAGAIRWEAARGRTS